MSSQWLNQHGAEPANANQVPVITSILKDFSAEALGELRTWLEQNPPAVTISSIIGFTQFSARVAEENSGAVETTTSTSYVDLATAGPSLTGLPDGQYLILHGSHSGTTAPGNAVQSVSINGATALDTDSTQCNAANLVSVSRGLLKTLSNGGNNSLVLKYRTTNAAVTASYQFRWLIATKIANA